MKYDKNLPIMSDVHTKFEVDPSYTREVTQQTQ